MVDMGKLIAVGRCLMIFMSGFVVALHLTKLIPSNPGQQGSWGSLIFACFLSIFFAAPIITKESKGT